MAPPRLDPWCSPKEWRCVYRLLYSPNTSSKQQGLSHVTMWSARCLRLPLAVECTGELVAASLLHGPGQVAAYSLAIIRFVNGHVDRGQGAVYARSVAGVANELGFPDWIVDIRHEATHKGVPSLERLEMAVRFALRWLEEKYWAPQNQCLEKGEERVREGLAGYLTVQARLQEMRVRGEKTNKTEIAHCVEQISSWSRYELGLLPGLMLSSLQDSSYQFSLWKPLLVQLHKAKPNVTAHLIYTLCRHYSTNSQNRHNIACFIVTIISENLFSDSCKAQHALYVEILLKSVNNPDTRSLCSTILNQCSDILTNKFHQLQQLFNIVSSSQTINSIPDDVYISKQVDNMKNVLKTVEEKTKEIPGKRPRFQRCTSQVWQSLPLGYTPDSLFPSLDLELTAGENTEGETSQDNFNYFDEIDVSNIDVEQVHLKTTKESRSFTKNRLEEMAASVQIFDDPDLS